jgi:hypothetical protein
MKTVTNKRLLISESQGNLNRCIPCRVKPDQHTTHFSRLIHVWLSTIRILRVPCIATFRRQQCWTDTTAPEKKCSRLHLSARLSGPWEPPQFRSQHNYWNSRFKPSIYWRHATRLTGSTSPVCDRYVQYLLAGVNPSVLNRHRQGLKSWRCQLATSHSPTFPTDGPPLFT